jgi:hypothetical protein
MKSSKPPALAAWLLEYFTPGDRHEALVGDLLEEFQYRRSAGWFWRQVLWAIPASFSHEMRMHWVARSAELGLAWIWVEFSWFHLLPFLRAKLWIMAFEPHARIVWWVLLMHPLTLELLPVFLAAYLLARNFNFLAFVGGLLVGALAVPPFTLTLGRAPVAFLVAHGLAARGLMGIMRWYTALIPTIPVVAGIWAAQMIKRRPGGVKVRG